MDSDSNSKSNLNSNITETTTSSPCTSSVTTFNQQHPKLLTEFILPHFNRTQFFFEPLNIRQQAQADRRFRQRLHRENSCATVTSFYLIGLDIIDGNFL